MLMSGRWCAFVFLWGLPIMALGAPKKGAVAEKRLAELASEQQKAFGLSANSRTLPANEWFVKAEYREIEDENPAETASRSRWMSQVDLSQVVPRYLP